MVSLYIDSTEVDLFPKTRIPLNLSLFEIQDFTRRKVFKSGKFNIPLTNNNKALFSFPDCMNTDAPGQLEATMIQDGLNFTGIIEIYEVQNKGGMKSLAIQLVQSDWIKQIEGRKLSDLTLDGHTVTEVNMIPPWDNQQSQNYIYPIADYGTFKGESSVFRETDILSVDVLPAVKIRNIVDAIFNEIGYKLTVNSFFTTNWKYFLLSGENAYINDKDYVEGRQFYATPPGTQTITNTTETPIIFSDVTSGDNFNNSTNYDTSTGIYTADKAGAHRFFVYVFFSWTGGYAPGNVGIRLRKNTLFGAAIGFVSGSYTTIGGSGTLGCESDYIHLEVGDTIFATFSQTEDPSPTTTIRSAESYFYNDLDRRRALGYTYNNIAEILPDMEQKEFLQTLKTLFNFYFYLNPYTREILMVQRDQFHNSTAINWSDKIDTGGNITIEFPNAPKQIRYGFDDDSNDAIKEAEGGNYIDVDLNSDSLTVDDVSVSAVADTYMGKCLRQGISVNDIPIIWKEYDNSLGWSASPAPEFNWKPRILHYEGKGLESYYFSGSIRSSIDTFSRLTPAQVAGFYTKFNKNLLNSKTLTAKFRLTPVEVDNMIVRQQGGDFRTPIYLDQDGIVGYYYLIAIKNYDGYFATATLQRINDKNIIGISDTLTSERAGLEFPYTLPIEY